MRKLLGLSIIALVAGICLLPASRGAKQSQTLATQPPADTFRQVADASATPQYQNVRGVAGFWRLGQTQDGVWWFISPDNRPEFLNTVTTVQPYQAGRESPQYLSADYDGNLETWAGKTLTRITDAGFKGLGAWSHPVFHKTNIPITRDLNIWAWMHGSAQRLYAPEFATTADEKIRAQVEPLRHNKSLVGYFLDNELEWGESHAGPANYFDELPADDPNRAQVIRVMQSLWPTPQQFNQDWKTELKNWKDLDHWIVLPRQSPEPYQRLFTAWLSHLAEDYFRITTTLVRKYDPNHLILGVRFKGLAVPQVVRASRGYTDVQSINYYPNDARLDPEMFRMMHELSGQPVMLSEYSFHALDGRSGNRNRIGFVAQVRDQQARAEGYHLMTTRLARVPYIIGADWFQWNDEPPSGRLKDGEDVNFGVVDIADKPYKTLVEAVRKTTPLLNGLHAASINDRGHDIWRESFVRSDAKPATTQPTASLN